MLWVQGLIVFLFQFHYFKTVKLHELIQFLILGQDHLSCYRNDNARWDRCPFELTMSKSCIQILNLTLTRIHLKRVNFSLRKLLLIVIKQMISKLDIILLHLTFLVISFNYFIFESKGYGISWKFVLNCKQLKL